MSIFYQIIAACGFIIFVVSPFLTYVFRSVVIVIYHRIKHQFFPPNRHDLLKEHYYSGVVLPSDIDLYFHMNNSRYAREADFARLSFYSKCGLTRRFFQKYRMMMAANTIRFRKSLEIFQLFKIRTQLVYWDQDSLYVEQRYVTKYKNIKEFVYCIALIKMKIVNGNTADFFNDFLSELPNVPKPSEELKLFMAGIEASSNSLKVEKKSD
ncbi:protein THEM6-like [Clavelina lepadiformis]|uniref:protein THEM6-like n=1 Tax=Clavelina lepadiformis TaxID=159417 RepID=UPI004041B4DE